MNTRHLCAIAVLALLPATPALAASDYLLEIDGFAGEAKASIEIQSWSWGTSHPGGAASQHEIKSPRDVATGQSSGKVQSGLAQTGGALASGAARSTSGDVDGDGLPDLARATAQDEIHGFTLKLDGTSPAARQLCAQGVHFPKATIKARTASYTLEDAVVTSCSVAGNANRAGGISNNSMPNRISMNVTVPKQTQGATFGERCVAGQCAAAPVTLMLTGRLREMTGHVTLIK